MVYGLKGGRKSQEEEKRRKKLQAKRCYSLVVDKKNPSRFGILVCVILHTLHSPFSLNIYMIFQVIHQKISRDFVHF